MARAQGARAQMALAFETTYGTPPASGFTRVPFASTTLGAEQPLINSELLGYGRDPLAPLKDAVTVDGDVVLPIDARALGFWLKAAFGQPTTSGDAPGPFTDHDEALVFDAVLFEPEAGFTASELRAGSDLAVDAQEAAGVLSSDRITETDILDGRWDNAAVEVWRVNWADVSQRVLMRRGAIGQIRRGRLAFVAEVRSLAHVLGQSVGRTFQTSCDAALGDNRCGVAFAHPAFSGAGTILDPLRDRSFTASGLGSFAPGWFAFGLLDWTRGANLGRQAEILAHELADGIALLTLLEPPVRPIAEGDLFIARAGCDKRIETCSAKFANTANFRGFPNIPGTDTVLRYATRDGGHEGAVL